MCCLAHEELAWLFLETDTGLDGPLSKNPTLILSSKDLCFVFLSKMKTEKIQRSLHYMTNRTNIELAL